MSNEICGTIFAGTSKFGDFVVVIDLVIVRETNVANDGDIVVALIDNGEATLKKLRKHGDRVELIPANQSMAPMIYPADRVHIQGVVVGQVRSY